MANYWNSSFQIRADAKRLKSKTSLKRSTEPMKRSGKLRPIRKVDARSDAKLKRDLTKVLSIYVRMRDPICIVCQQRSSEHGGHLYHRDMPSVEFDPRNVWGVCAPCNYHHEDHPQPMHDAVLKRLGERAYDDLRTLANDHKMKLGRIELEILFSELSERIAEQKRV